MSPTYILNGKSLIYWNGKIIDITCKNLGKNGIGTTTPDKRSAIATKIFTIPFSFIVFNTIIGYKVMIDVTSSVPTIKVKINNIKCIGDAGNDRLNGSGKRDVTNIRGIHLKETIANLLPRILKYHIKYKFFGLAYS